MRTMYVSLQLPVWTEHVCMYNSHRTNESAIKSRAYACIHRRCTAWCIRIHEDRLCRARNGEDPLFVSSGTSSYADCCAVTSLMRDHNEVFRLLLHPNICLHDWCGSLQGVMMRVYELRLLAQLRFLNGIIALCTAAFLVS